MKYNWFLLILLFINPLMVLSMNSLLSIWINMELNLILFITFIIMNNLYMYDLSMKYFLINSMSSSLFLFFLMMNYMNLIIFFDYILNLMMLIKLGMPPFHFWYIDMMMNLNWMSCLILSTWQKFIPLIIIFFILKLKFMFLMILFGGLISIIYGLLSIYLKIIISFSSINHLSWMIFSMCYSLNLWMIYYFSYLIINISLFNMFNLMNLIFINDLIKMNFFFKKKIYLMMMMSMGGLPPFFGFLLKWFFIYKLIFMNNIFMLFMLIFFSLIFLYYYIRLIFNFMFMSYNLIKYNFYLMIYNNMKMNLFIYILSLMNLFMLIIYLN